MRIWALLLVICLLGTALPGFGVAEEAESARVDAMPGAAEGDTGAPGLVAVSEDEALAESLELPEVWVDGEAEPPEEMEVAALPMDFDLTDDGGAPEAEAPQAPAVEAAEAGEGGTGETAPQAPPAVPTPHTDPNGPQLAVNEITLGVGETCALQPFMPVGREGAIICASADAAVAPVAEDGTVTAAAPGDTVVTATAWDGTYAECFVHVRKAPDKIAFDSKNFELGKGESTDALHIVVGSVPGEFAGACTFTSSNEKIVKVDANGALKGVKTGKATIRARSYNGRTASCKVTVVKAPGKVTATADKRKLGVGETGRISYTLPKGTASQASFESENPEVVAVDGKTGELLAVAVGKTRVRVATFNKKKAYVTVSVAPAPESLTFESEALRLGVGMQLAVSAKLSDGAAGSVSYVVEDKSVATFKNGKLKGVAPGETAIVATAYNGLTARCAVVVTAAPKKVKLPYKTLNVGVRQALRLQPDTGDCASSFTYASANKKIATVSADGVVKGVRKGSTTVTIKTYNKKTFKLKVNVLKAPGSVKLSPEQAQLGVGETVSLSCTLPSKTAGTVTYSSGDEAIAVVDAETGLVTAVAPGVATITATTHNGKKAKATIEVFGLPEWIEADEGFVELSEGESKPLTFKFSPGGRSALHFASQNPAVAEISEAGVVTGVGVGQTIISVTTNAPGVACEVSVTVMPATSAIRLEPAELSLNVGETWQLTPVIDAGTTARLSYASSNDAVAEVSAEGMVVAKARGTATLTVTTHNDKTASVKLTVLEPWYPEKVELLNAPGIMDANSSLQLEWSVSPESAVADLVWSTSNKSVATVDENGILRTGSYGFAVLTATSRRNSAIKLEFTVAVETGNVTLEIPARTTDIDGIPGNLAKIDAIRVSAINQIQAMKTGKVITEADANKRKSMVNNAFKDYAFPWMTPALQKYWKAANSEGGVKDFKPDRVYYGLPYVSTGKNRQYNAAKALSEKRFTDSGAGYYMLDQDNLLKGIYCGNDCSCFVDAAIWGTNSSHSADRTAEIAKSSAYKTIKGFKTMRTGDLICKGYAHVVMFLYYANADKTQVMIIENGGVEPGTNTVHCMIMDVSYYSSKGYSVRRLASLG